MHFPYSPIFKLIPLTESDSHYQEKLVERHKHLFFRMDGLAFMMLYPEKSDAAVSF